MNFYRKPEKFRAINYDKVKIIRFDAENFALLATYTTPLSSPQASVAL